MNHSQGEAWRDQIDERKHLADIEQMLDSVNLRTLTPDYLSQLDADLSRTIEGLHNIPNGENFTSVIAKEAVLGNLLEARYHLHIALVELLGKKAKPEKFYESLRRCQTLLEKALANW